MKDEKIETCECSRHARLTAANRARRAAAVARKHFRTNVSDTLVQFSAAAVCDCKAVWNGYN